MIELFSQIVVTKSFESVIDEIKALTREREFELFTLVKDGNFLVDDVDLVVERAYILQEKQEVLLLGAKNFSEIVQNRLLKILEEPPEGKIFILLFPRKGSILKTVRSRLPITTLHEKETSEPPLLNLETLTLEECYQFVQKYKGDSQEEMKSIIQKILKDALKSKKYKLTQKDLESFSSKLKALNYGSPAGFVLIGVLLKLLAVKEKGARS